jgi:D-threo-aldose 1-dehydrogenase
MDPLEKVPVGQTKVTVTRLGLGGAALGNMYEAVSDEQANSTIQKALQLGIRHVDTAPEYGVSLSESRVGRAIRDFPKNVLTISTKVGRLLRKRRSENSQWIDAPPLESYFDFSKKGVLESYKNSLERLGTKRADILFIHDPDDDLEEAANQSFPALDELRTQGDVTAIGAGMNDWEKELWLAKSCKLDCFLLAGRYTLLEQGALEEFLPYCEKQGISIIIGGPYNSGILASDLDSREAPMYNYEVAPSDILEKAKRIKRVCDRHGVPIKAAALQFVVAHPAVISTIPGSRSPDEVEENFRLMKAEIPPKLWEDLKDEKLIARNSPVPNL